jgi:aldose sugar dehydrogenase
MNLQSLRHAARAANLVLATLLFYAGSVAAQESSLRPVTVVRGLANPWGLAFLPGFENEGRMLVTEKRGQMRIASVRGELGPPLEGLPPVDARGQGGLLDVALDPRFTETRWVYCTGAMPSRPEAAPTAPPWRAASWTRRA